MTTGLPTNPLMPAADLVAFGQLLEMVYECALEPSRWTDTLSQMVDWVGARKSLFFTPTLVPEDGGFVFSHRFAESFIELWRTKYQESDVWVKAASERDWFREGRVLFGHDMVPTRTLMRSDWYREFLSLEDVAHLLCGVIFGLDSQAAPPVTFCTYRGAADRKFDDVERARVELLLPHLSRAVGVMLRLRDAEYKVAASLAALERLPAAVLLVDQGGRVVFANLSAQRILAREDGLRLRAATSGQSMPFLVADGSAAAQDRLAQAIREVIARDYLGATHFGHAVAVPRRSGRTPFVINLSCLPRRNEFGQGADAPRAILFVNDPARPMTVPRELLREVYGLTAAEARTADAAACQGTIAEIAANLGITEHTVRSQLKTIYAKTGVDSRARLVKLVMALSVH